MSFEALDSGLLASTGTPTGAFAVANEANVVTTDAHIQNRSNPHVVTASQVGAYTTSQVDTAIATKANKASAPTAGHLATLDGSGNPTDSGKVPPSGVIVGTTDTQTLTGKTISGGSNTLSNIPESAVTNLTSDLAAKASKASSPTAGHLATLDGGGNPVDSGITPASKADTSAFTAHTGATGTSVHGLGTASTHDATDFATPSDLAAFLSLGGGTMTGSIDMGGNSLTNGTFAGNGAGLTDLPAPFDQALNTTSDVTFNTATTTGRILTGTHGQAASGSITPDAAAGNQVSVALTGDLTINPPSNPIDGQGILYKFIQAELSATVTFSGFRFGPLTMPAIASWTTCYVSTLYNSDSSTWDIIAIANGY